MFAKTTNEYRFKYLVTGLTGKGIECVYLPPVPNTSKILFKKEQKFTRPVPSEEMQEWQSEYEHEKELFPDYVHPHQDELDAWAEREFERCSNGIHFWNNGVITFITGDYYKYLTQWNLLFGFPDYRENDRETFFWIKYWEEDPFSYGGLYFTLRREGKSTKMGFWLMNRTSTNFKHISGCQGEDNTKIKDFYDQMIIEPFYKLPYYSKPTYDTTTLQKKGIIFKEPPRRNRKIIHSRKKLVLESRMDYRTSEANKYDQAKLHSSAVEEFGKTLSCDVSLRWAFMKPCHTLGMNIIGKAFWATTCEFMDVTDKGGKVAKKLAYQSDFDIRGSDGQTTSGLYAAMMPADCAFEGCFDDYGHPQRERARKIILSKREAVKDNPKEYSGLIRKYPLNWMEVFYISSEKCEFNATILQDRRAELMANPPQIRKVRLSWENNIRFSRVIIHDDPDNGWYKMAWVPKTEEEKAWFNDVERKMVNGAQRYSPKNGNIFGSGVDPIDHGVVVDDVIGDQQFVSSRRSRPVQFVKRKYDSSIDGLINQEILEQRARDKYRYKTNRYIGMMDVRPNDPNVFFERSLMISWLNSCPICCESQKPGLINWYVNAGCEDFLQNKHVPVEGLLKKGDMLVKGTAASSLTIQDYTGRMATDIEYFGHCYDYIELIDDDLVFDPLDTKKFDYSVGSGWTEVGCAMKPQMVSLPMRQITDFFPMRRRDGVLIK